MKPTAPATPAQTGASTAPLPRPAALRAVAAWLESHPEATPYSITFVFDETAVDDYASKLRSLDDTDAAVGRHALTVDPDLDGWEVEQQPYDGLLGYYRISRPIAPGVVYRITRFHGRDEGVEVQAA